MIEKLYRFVGVKYYNPSPPQITPEKAWKLLELISSATNNLVLFNEKEKYIKTNYDLNNEGNSECEYSSGHCLSLKDAIASIITEMDWTPEELTVIKKILEE